MPIYNGRAIADNLSLEREGFILVRHDTRVKDFYQESEIRSVYYPGDRAAGKANLPARKEFWCLTTRSARPTAQPAKRNRSAVRCAMRIMITPNGPGPQRVRDLLPGEAEELLKRRFAVVQVWRPIRHPVQREPLAIADARSIGMKELIPSSRVYPDRVGEVYHCAYNPDTPLVLLSQYAASRSSGVQNLRLDKRRPRPVDGSYGLRRSNQSARCPTAGKHRDANLGFLLIR